MAKFITVTHGEDFNSASTNYEAIFIETGTKSTTVCTDVMTGDQIIFKGRNLKYEDGRINSGTIDKMILADDDGNPLQTFSGLNLNPGIVAGASMYEFASDVATRAVLGNLKVFGTSDADSFTTTKGNDRIFGRGGDDTLSAGTGRDQMTGGAGLDTFVFSPGQGRDTIMDFDADGGVGNQDHIDGTFPGGGNISQSGNDTIVDFGGGDFFVLKNVLATQIDATDFV